MGRKKVYKEEVINLLKECVGWENGKTSREVAEYVYDKSDAQSIAKALSALRAAKNYFLASIPPMVLHSRAKKIKTDGISKLEWRWFLVKTSEEAWHADDILVIRLDKTTRQLRFQMPVLNGLLTDGQKTELIKRLATVSVSLQLPPGQTVEVK